ncbi:hypothetical protein J7399_11920 [Shimia sp. R9_1]|uniref:hypothetical protein n=1 Tax=unclassified Shimia TaxID=2630038 RepID=UPI001ADA2E55|nr:MULTISPECIES: hypothetical protein [unclassified Shimia]MBO9401644.1 hypothetical protein [Shimia sp. R9_3]MBO9408140.1 hypothetical protein [Shimia sp. R9_1]
MNFRHLIRMSQWARNPPSEKRVKLVFGVIILCIVLVLIERFVGWPDALTLDPKARTTVKF